jgi:catalase
LTSNVDTSLDKKTTNPSVGGTLPRLASVGVIVLGVVGAFLYLGGWFSPHELTPARFTDGFEQAAGVHSGFRRNHAKGVCVTGFFESNGQGARLSKAEVFQVGRFPVVGRFSIGGGNPYAADAPDSVRALALQFSQPDGEKWRTAMISLPVFPFKDPQGFYDNMMAGVPDPNTHKADPEKMKAFLANHPETIRALGIIKSHPLPSGFDDSTFYGLNAFRFVDANGTSTPVRWTLVPVQPFVAADNAAMQTDKNYLFDGLIASMHQHPLQWRLVVILGQAGDSTSDPSSAWPDTREHVDAGTVTIDTIESEENSPTRDINFDPLVLPAGIAPSDDPFLSARSAVYSQSFTRRAGEKKEPSAITPSEVQK